MTPDLQKLFTARLMILGGYTNVLVAKEDPYRDIMIRIIAKLYSDNKAEINQATQQD